MGNYSHLYQSPIGNLLLRADSKFLLSLSFTDINNHEGALNEVLEKTRKELDEYFDGKRKNFTIPLTPEGTEFQKSAWKALQKIPYGETRSYKEEAILAGNPKAIRAIGGANNKNPIVIIVPCHRVIGADGSLVGYGGGIERKKWLLEFEKHHR